jgi:hypothetical protein
MLSFGKIGKNVPPSRAVVGAVVRGTIGNIDFLFDLKLSFY